MVVHSTEWAKAHRQCLADRGDEGRRPARRDTEIQQRGLRWHQEARLKVDTFWHTQPTETVA